MGFGDIIIPQFINLTSTINQTIQSLSSVSYLFDALLESEVVVNVGMGTEEGIGVLFPYVSFLNFENISADFDVRERPWYVNTAGKAKDDKNSTWSVYSDMITHEIVATASAPIFNGSEFFGVLAIDISLKPIIWSLANVQYKESGYSLLLDESFNIVAKTDIKPNTNRYDMLIASENIFFLNNQKFNGYFSEAWVNQSGFFLLT